MNLRSRLALCAQAAKAFTSSRAISATISALALSLGLATASQAALITGEALPHGTWVPNSTNALNYDQEVPGREGQGAPYVLFNSAAVGSVTLDFFNFAPGLAFFEIRIDGVQTGATPHLVIPGDTIHTGGNSVASGTSNQLTKSANSYVDVRLALGGERDWDFDWVRFRVVPEPGTLAILGIGLAGIGFIRRRKLSG